MYRCDLEWGDSDIDSGHATEEEEELRDFEWEDSGIESGNDEEDFEFGSNSEDEGWEMEMRVHHELNTDEDLSEKCSRLFEGSVYADMSLAQQLSVLETVFSHFETANVVTREEMDRILLDQTPNFFPKSTYKLMKLRNTLVSTVHSKEIPVCLKHNCRALAEQDSGRYSCNYMGKGRTVSHTLTPKELFLFHYFDLHQQLRRMLRNSEIRRKLNAPWENTDWDGETLGEPWTGKEWQRVVQPLGEGSLGVILSQDGFDTSKKNGLVAITISFANFVSSERHKSQHQLLVGLAAKSCHNNNPFLTETVAFLQDLFHGITVDGGEIIRGGLLMVVGDFPGLQEIAGLTKSARATMSCRYCEEKGAPCKTTGGTTTVFRPWDDPEVPRGRPRTRESVLSAALKQEHNRIHLFNADVCPDLHRELNSWANKIKKVTSETGVTSRSCLFDVPGFQLDKQIVVDTMHNVFLGTFKKEVALVVQYLSNSQKEFLEYLWQTTYSDRLCAMGRQRIAKSPFEAYANYKADEWLSFAFVAVEMLERIRPTDPSSWRRILKSVLLHCRLIYYLHLHLISRDRVLTIRSLVHAHTIAMQEAWGLQTLVCNFHYRYHLVDFILLFGAPSSFWAYFVERRNGLLKKLKAKTNNKFLSRDIGQVLERRISLWYSKLTAREFREASPSFRKQTFLKMLNCLLQLKNETRGRSLTTQNKEKPLNIRCHCRVVKANGELFYVKDLSFTASPLSVIDTMPFKYVLKCDEVTLSPEAITDIFKCTKIHTYKEYSQVVSAIIQ
eukprot:GCRY01000250.1.p1 GENE.GCRY01000250.1~~GCRY01000250.1.p1  ORF type:complete len:783 (-),score=75.28 GCRY01000250.1:293-2641(-)